MVKKKSIIKKGKKRGKKRRKNNMKTGKRGKQELGMIHEKAEKKGGETQEKKGKKASRGRRGAAAHTYIAIEGDPKKERIKREKGKLGQLGKRER